MSRVFLIIFIVLIGFRVDVGDGSTPCISARFDVRSEWRFECFSRPVHKHDKKKRTVECFREYAERVC